MAKADVTTVDEYLHQLPDERRAVIEEVRNLILRHLPDGYTENVNWGMLTYEIPLSRYPNTYNKQPLGYLALAAQKNYYALYLNCVYVDPSQEEKLRAAYRAMNKKMDMGKSCLRFRKLEDLPMETLGEIIADTPPDEFIAQYEAARKK